MRIQGIHSGNFYIFDTTLTLETMKHKEMAELTDDELLAEAKRMKPTKLYDAVIFGFLIGIAIYSSVKNGFGWLTFLPIVYLPVAAKNKAKIKVLEELMADRDLKE